MEKSELTALVKKAQGGDKWATETLVGEIQNKIYYHCLKMMKNEDDALDATQDVLLEILKALPNLKEPEAFMGWVNTITANHCKRKFTRTTTEYQIPEDEDGNSMLGDLENTDASLIPEEVAENKETRRLVMEIVNALPDEQKMTVLFYYYDEMSVKEIAEAMDCKEGTVMSRLNYARKAIKKAVEDLEKRDGIKLYGLSPLILLGLFFRQEAKAAVLSPALAASVTGTAVTAATEAASAGTATAAGSAAAGTGAAGVGAAGVSTGAAGVLAGKGTVLLLAGALVGGFAVGGIGVSVKNHVEERAFTKPEPSAVVETVAPSETVEPEESETVPPWESSTAPAPSLPTGETSPMLSYFHGIPYYGNPEQCKMTPEQATAFADCLDAYLSDLYKTDVSHSYTSNDAITTHSGMAALIDPGNGVPLLIYMNALLSESKYGSGYILAGSHDPAFRSVNYAGGNTDEWTAFSNGRGCFALYPKGIVIQSTSSPGDDPSVDERSFFAFAENGLSETPTTSVVSEPLGQGSPFSDATFSIDGVPVTEVDFLEWFYQNLGAETASDYFSLRVPRGELEIFTGSDISIVLEGTLSPAEEVSALLRGFAEG